jgi:nucleoid-associated protein YgaU
MKTLLVGCGMLAVLIPVTVNARALDDDVRCMLVSSGYARLAKDENSRRASAMTAAFYLGRINGRFEVPALSAAIRAQGDGVPAKEAEPLMRACAARASAAQDLITTIVKQAQSNK